MATNFSTEAGNYRLSLLLYLINQVKVFFFGFAIFGYGVISFLVDDASNSRRVTVPYRFTVLMLSFLVILSSLRKEKKRGDEYRRESKRNTANLHQTLLFILLLFIFIYSIRLLLEISILDKILTQPPNEYLLNWLGICLIPGLAFLFTNSKQSNNYLYCSWLFLTVISCLVLFIDPQTSLAFRLQGRLTNPALDPISLSHYGTSLVLTSAFILVSKQRRFVLTDIIYLLAIFLGCFSLFIGGSRGPVVALLACLVLLYFGAVRSRINFKKLSGIIIAFLGIAAITSLLATRLGSLSLYRLEGIFTQNIMVATSDSNRLSYLQKGFELIWNNLILGYGLELPGIGYPHNLVLEAFLGTGVFGGLIFTGIYLYSVVKAISLIRNDWKRWGWLGIIFIQYAIAALIAGTLYKSYTFWYLLFAVISRKTIKQLAPSNSREAI